MKKVNLEYCNIPAHLPDIDYFLEKISTYNKFNFLRVNHGFIDSLYHAYPNYNLLKEHLQNHQYELIATNVHKSYLNKDWGFKYFHGDTKKISEYSSLVFKLLVENKNISKSLDMAISLGVGLNTYWGVWEQENPIQKARVDFANILTEITNHTYIYSGIFKHYTIKKEIFQMFELLNNMNYEVIFLGPNFFGKYGDVFSIRNFNFIEIPKKGAIENTEFYIEKIKDIQQNSFKPTILFHMCGHIISAKIVYELLDTSIFTVDVGRSFDILIKEEFINGNQEEKCWTFLDNGALNNYVNNLRENSYG